MLYWRNWAGTGTYVNKPFSTQSDHGTSNIRSAVDILRFIFLHYEVMGRKIEGKI